MSDRENPEGVAIRVHIQCGWLCQALESVPGPARRREGRTIMNYRRITELLGAAGAAVGAVAVGTEIAQAQDDLGANIANTVTNAVSSVATNSGSGGTLIGGVSTESNSVDLGEQTGTAIADASGGNNNVSFVS
jgi:hypothetical protein